MKGEPSKTVRERVEATGPCVVLDGGVRHGWWYRLEDWRRMREAAMSALSRKQMIEDTITGYAPTDEQRTSDLDKYEGLVATVWRWQP